MSHGAESSMIPCSVSRIPAQPPTPQTLARLLGAAGNKAVTIDIV